MLCRMARFGILGLLCLSMACGAYSELDDFSDRGGSADTDVPDGGVDSSLPDTGRPDAGPDVGPPDTGVDADVGPDVPDAGSLEVICAPPQMTRPGDPVDVVAEVIGEPPFRGEWTVDGMGEFSIDPPGEPRTTFVGFDPGSYFLTYRVTDTIGNTGSCETLVAVVNGPPIASCPGEEQVGAEFEPIFIRGAGFDDEGIVETQWRQVEGSSDDVVEILEPGSPETPVIGPAGRFVLRLTVTDTDGARDSCDVVVRFTAPPLLACPTPVRSPTFVPVTVQVPGMDDTAIISHEWSFVRQPEGASGEFDRLRNERATFTPMRHGAYSLLYIATDTDGLSSSCVVEVTALDTPPMLECPDEIRATPMRPFDAEIGAIDDGEIVRFTWDLTLDESNVDRATTDVPLATLTPLIAGRHVLNVTARDEGGQTASCEINVLVVSDDGLRVEVLWDTETDMDTHLLNPTATRWFNNDDCYYANCRSGLAWEPEGTDNDPFLDIDDTDGFGPENINIETAEPGEYRVGVHAFSGNSNVTVRIYCGGSRVDPVLELGPTRLPSGQFWRVADVDIRSAIDCTVTPLISGGIPNITTAANARTTR